MLWFLPLDYVTVVQIWILFSYVWMYLQERDTICSF